MKVYFRTNLDWYKEVSFPIIDVVPHKGEVVNVHIQSEPFCKENHIPTQLEVTQVTYFYDHVECELWYKKIDIEFAKLEENRMKHLFKN